MSTSDLSLTQDEQTLHHYAAMFKKELEAYHAWVPRNEGVWRKKFRARLKISVDYYFSANKRNPIPLCIHPLLVSLMEVFKEGRVSVNMSSVSENDPRILSSNYYTSPKNLPLLNIHLQGQNGADPISGTHVCPLTLAASCRECMGSLASETSAAIGSSTTPIPRKRKKDRHLSGSGVRKIVTRSAAKRSAANDFGEAATGTTSKRKGEPLHPEENIDDNWEDEAQPLNKGLSASPGPATPQPRAQRLTRSQTLAASSRNEEPGNSSSHAIPTGSSHQNEVANDVPDDANAIQEILDSAGLRVQRLTRSQMLAASSRNEEPRSSSSHAIPTGNSHQNEDVPDDGNTIQEILDSGGLRVQRLTRSQTLAASSRNEQPGSSSSQASTIPTGNSHQNEEILDSTGLIPYQETNEEAFPSDGEDINNVVKQLKQEIQHLKTMRRSLRHFGRKLWVFITLGRH
ncbi:hypothetical protein EDB85DRAFT_2158982 [Lactarius pseudohatsudake]|nr:hypothetical protein EDB85DRAFT_2158982 [Lactarius pseudohatsudake]